MNVRGVEACGGSPWRRRAQDSSSSLVAAFWAKPGEELENCNTDEGAFKLFRCSRKIYNKSNSGNVFEFPSGEAVGNFGPPTTAKAANERGGGSELPHALTRELHSADWGCSAAAAAAGAARSLPGWWFCGACS